MTQILEEYFKKGWITKEEEERIERETEARIEKWLKDTKLDDDEYCYNEGKGHSGGLQKVRCPMCVVEKHNI